MVSRRAESEVQAVTGGRVARRGSKRRHRKNSVLRFLLKEAKDELYIG